jgi:hypothetical protein
MPMNPRLLRPTASGFNPRSIAGLLVWLDAADASYDASTGTWADKSGAGRNFTQTESNNRPTVSTTKQNGKTILEFDGSNDQLQNQTNFLQISSCTLFGVYRRLGNPFGGIISSAGSADRSPALLLDGSAAILRGFSNFSQSASGVANSFSVTSGTVSNGDTVLFINGSQVDSDAAANTLDTSQTTTSIGTYRQAAANFFNGYIAEILAYNRALSASERQRVERYLGKKWGITVA